MVDGVNKVQVPLDSELPVFAGSDVTHDDTSGDTQDSQKRDSQDNQGICHSDVIT